MRTIFWSVGLKGRERLIRPDMKMDVSEIRLEVVELMRLAQDLDHWWALVNTAMNLRVSIKDGEFLN